MDVALQAHEKLIATTRRTARDHMERAKAAVAARKEAEGVLANAERVHADAPQKVRAAACDDARAECARLVKEVASAQREAQNVRAQLGRAMERVLFELSATVCGLSRACDAEASASHPRV